MINIVRTSEIELQEFSDENILGALLPATKHFSASYGVVRPNESQRHHVQSRPGKGDELIIVVSGMFKIRTANEYEGPFDADKDGAVFIHVPSDVPASLVNIGNSDLKFFGVFTPPFELGEINYID